MIWYCMKWYEMIWYGMIWYDMIWYGMIWYDMIWYDLVYWIMIWRDIKSGQIRSKAKQLKVRQKRDEMHWCDVVMLHLSPGWIPLSKMIFLSQYCSKIQDFPTSCPPPSGSTTSSVTDEDIGWIYEIRLLDSTPMVRWDQSPSFFFYFYVLIYNNKSKRSRPFTY